MLALVIVLVRVVVAYALLLHDGHELRPAGAGKAARALLGRAALLLRRVGVLIAGRKGPRAVALAVGAVSAALAVGALLAVALAIGALLPVALAVGTALSLGALLLARKARVLAVDQGVGVVGVGHKGPRRIGLARSALLPLLGAGARGALLRPGLPGRLRRALGFGLLGGLCGRGFGRRALRGLLAGLALGALVLGKDRGAQRLLLGVGRGDAGLLLPDALLLGADALGLFPLLLLLGGELLLQLAQLGERILRALARAGDLLDELLGACAEEARRVGHFHLRHSPSTPPCSSLILAIALAKPSSHSAAMVLPGLPMHAPKSCT